VRGLIVVLNAGSSSIKFSIFDSPDGALELLFRGEIGGIGIKPRFWIEDSSGSLLTEEDLTREEGVIVTHEDALNVLIEWISRNSQGKSIKAIGHRVVHGGSDFREPIVIDEYVLSRLKTFVPLAPLHQPHNLAGILAIRKINPRLTQVACFDTAFHRTQPRVAELFALPLTMFEEGIRRYGFHGLSYEYISTVLPSYAGKRSMERVVVAHLGNGASMCAMRGLRSVATTMGFTALDGLPMGTRSGSIDPGVILYLIEEKGMSTSDIADLLYHRSGLLGVSGISSDMRVLEASSDERASEAIHLFVYRIARELGSLAGALGGLDVLVFTAGIGENSSLVREKVCQASSWLGIEIDRHANISGERKISTEESKVDVYVIPTDEELMIARHTLKLVAG
jgi:acetate kinase